MTTVPFNHARTSIDTTIRSAEYGAQMVERSAQHGRDNNRDAAIAALTLAWRTHDAARVCVELLPVLAPEHAALMGRTERQSLVESLNNAAERIVRLTAQNRLTLDTLEGYDDQISNWYALCFETGHYLHLAKAMSRTHRAHAVSEEDTQNATFAIALAHDNARQSLDRADEHAPPAHAPFPQTRQQVRQQAAGNCNALQALANEFNQKAAVAKAEGDNSPGNCHVCGLQVRADDVARHTKTCIMDAVRNRYTVRDVDERHARGQPIMLWVRSEELRHWMMLIVQPTTSLRQLDRFLRDTWLECCGHMSQFEIGEVDYSSHAPGPSEPTRFDPYLEDFDPEHMMHSVERTVSAGQRFQHQFDYGNTTRLDLQHVDTLPVSYQYLHELINPPDDAGPHQPDFITIVARNLPPQRCFTCGDVAHRRYDENPYSLVPPREGGPVTTGPYFCASCAPGDVTTIAVRNSPRVGVSCYDHANRNRGQETD